MIKLDKLTSTKWEKQLPRMDAMNGYKFGTVCLAVGFFYHAQQVTGAECKVIKLRVQRMVAGGDDA